MVNTAKAGARYFPNLKDQVPYHAETEFRQLRSMAYDLLDAKLDIVDKTLAASALIDRDLVAGRLLAIVARQNSVGCWSVQFATNKDGSLKFKGTSVVTPVTTANTYTVYIFLAMSEIEALLIAHETGGNLS